MNIKLKHENGDVSEFNPDKDKIIFNEVEFEITRYEFTVTNMSGKPVIQITATV